MRFVAIVLIPTLLLAAEASAASTRLTFVAVETSDGSPGVMSELFRREDGGPRVRLGTSGQPAREFEHTETECSSSVQYTVVPINAPIYTFPADDWRSCVDGASYRFEFTPNLGDDDRAIIYQIFSDRTIAYLSPQQAEIIEGVTSNGDLGSLTFLSTEIGTAYMEAGDSELGQQWLNAAVATGWAAVARAKQIEVDYVPFEYEDNVLVYTDAAKQVIAAYQADAGLPDDGRLNWPTMRSLSDLAQSDIDALSLQRLDVIKPIMIP